MLALRAQAPRPGRNHCAKAAPYPPARQRLARSGAGPAVERQNQRTRPVRLCTIRAMRQNRKRRLLLFGCRYRGFSCHAEPPRNHRKTESQPKSVGQPKPTCLDANDPSWGSVDLEDDGLIDGYVHCGFLAPTEGGLSGEFAPEPDDGDNG